VPAGSVQFWKNRYFANGVLYLIPMCPIAILPGIYAADNQDLPVLIASYAITVTAILFVALAGRLSVFVRKLIFNSALYFMSFMLLNSLGSKGPGLLYLLGILIFVLISLDRKFGVIAFGLNTLICTYFGVAIYLGFASRMMMQTYDLNIWVGRSSELIFLSGISVLLIPQMFEGLQTTSEELVELVEEKEVLLSEIHHRVKNNLAVVSGMMQLQAFKTEDESLKDKLLDGVLRIQTMANIHEFLYNSENFTELTFHENLKNLIDQVAKTLNSDIDLTINFELEKVNLNINQAIPCSLIINEVITNAIKHGFDGRETGMLFVSLSEQKGHIYLQIEDDGQGLPREFGTDQAEPSLGIKLIDTLARQLDANYEYTPLEQGTRFEVEFDKADIKGSVDAQLL